MRGDDALATLLDVTEGRFYGKYRGRVMGHDDGTRRARLRVKVPAVMGDAEIWALPCLPYAGPEVAFVALPPEGASIWVEFEGGDPSRPIWVGAFLGENAIPAEDAREGVKLIRTAAFTIRIDDDEDTLEIFHAGGATLRMTGTEIVLEASVVELRSGGKKIALRATGMDVHDGALEVA